MTLEKSMFVDSLKLSKYHGQPPHDISIEKKKKTNFKIQAGYVHKIHSH